jgi:hypothetical protein
MLYLLVLLLSLLLAGQVHNDLGSALEERLGLQYLYRYHIPGVRVQERLLPLASLPVQPAWAGLWGAWPAGRAAAPASMQILVLGKVTPSLHMPPPHAPTSGQHTPEISQLCRRLFVRPMEKCNLTRTCLISWENVQMRMLA